jgi:hypothetical protein
MKKQNKMAKKPTKIVIKGTKEGKLYIDAAELLALDSVQELIKRVLKSKALDDTKHVALK